MQHYVIKCMDELKQFCCSEGIFNLMWIDNDLCAKSFTPQPHPPTTSNGLPNHPPPNLIPQQHLMVCQIIHSSTSTPTNNG